MYRIFLLSSEKSSTNQSWCLLAWSSFTAPQTQRSMTFLEKYLSFGSRTWNRKRSLQVPLPDAKGAIRMKGSERLENGRCKVKASPKSKSFLTPRFRWIRSFLFGWAISSTRITSTLWSLEGEDSNDLKSLIVIFNIFYMKVNFSKGLWKDWQSCRRFPEWAVCRFSFTFTRCFIFSACWCFSFEMIYNLQSLHSSNPGQRGKLAT